MNATTKRLNAKFKKADAAGKRVLIAKDVLAQLKAEKFMPSEGVWARIEHPIEKGTDIQVCEINTNRTTCRACALGAMMLSEIRFNNELKLSDVEPSWNGAWDLYYQKEDGISSQGERLESFFTKKQLRLIELAFEGGWGFFKQPETKIEGRAVAMYGKYQYDDDKRMRAIMENIVANNGEFKP